MKKQLEAVSEFHRTFKLGVSRQPLAKLDENLHLLRHKLMAEENDEYLEAASQGDLIGVADALGDMLYILCGTILEHGMQDTIEDVFMEIQRSNMSKLGEDGEPLYREDGKVIKGPMYTPPKLDHFFKD